MASALFNELRITALSENVYIPSNEREGNRVLAFAAIRTGCRPSVAPSPPAVGNRDASPAITGVSGPHREWTLLYPLG